MIIALCVLLVADIAYMVVAQNNEAILWKGNVIEIRLVENPSTGYGWELNLTDGLQLVSNEYKPPTALPNDIKIFGGAGVRIYRIEATGFGSQSITETYKRPWETNIAKKNIVKVFVL